MIKITRLLYLFDALAEGKSKLLFLYLILFLFFFNFQVHKGLKMIFRKFKMCYLLKNQQLEKTKTQFSIFFFYQIMSIIFIFSYFNIYFDLVWTFSVFVNTTYLAVSIMT